MRSVITPGEAERRLLAIFPRGAFDPVFSSPLAGQAVAALIYLDAVCSASDAAEDVNWARPSGVLWMSADVFAKTADDERTSWRMAASKGNSAVEELHHSWGMAFAPPYRDNSRETLRDETFRKWREHSALRMRPGLPTSSSKARWALFDDFADLFDPKLLGEKLEEAAASWRDNHLDAGVRLKASFALNLEASAHAVSVNLPDATTRTLEPGLSSVILKGVVETWATSRLIQPVVLAISEPGDKVHIGDERTLQSLGIKLDQANILPDALIADIGGDQVHFWIIEAVASDGPVTNERRQALLRWASEQNIKTSSCSFLTAFLSRNHPAAKKRLKDVASNTWAWFADEPGHELAWYQIVPGID